MKRIGLCVVTVMALLVLAGKNVLAGGGDFEAEILSEGWLPVKGKENTFQSYALSVLKTHDNRDVVFSTIW